MYMTSTYELNQMDSDLAFKIRLQVSLLKNATEISKFTGETEKFREYINVRKGELSDLLNNPTDPVITLNGKRIYP